ncbi:hypothetical protein EDD18DRAFT_1107739 [Armillaria luteobubalina]|uniref:Uncharacterized protein n=1 Tax=Armillaria luteobubalina TaxID=153913 RepID=A0AA39Q0Y2_9AGAR|nr:hypothetical protein EDD18DRAFT_1107739 [Armillaria luteobubalina]
MLGAPEKFSIFSLQLHLVTNPLLIKSRTNMSNNPNSLEPPPMGHLLYYEWQGQRYLIDYKVFNFTLVQGQYLDDQAGKQPNEDIVKSFFDYFNKEEQAAQGDPIVMQVCKWVHSTP